MSSAILRGKVNPNDAGHHLTLAEALLMQSLSGDHRIIRAMADELGYVLIPAPAISDEDISHALTRTCAEFGGYMRVIDEAMQDGQITTNERRDLERELGNMIGAATHLQALLSGRAPAA
jgi:hypothetical protein